jgi:hypothetical protein
MAAPGQSLRIVGVHPVVPTREQFREAVDLQWGSDLVGEELSRAEDSVRDHFSGLYLLEVEVDPTGSEIGWDSITQPMRNQPRENWQAVYDEQRIGTEGNRWVFFFHYLDLTRPLRTEFGELVLPRPTPMPSRLSSIVYDVTT